MKKVNKVFKIGISKKNGEKINEINEIEVLAGKGIVGDRHFRDSNDYKGQITLIEKENIDYSFKFDVWVILLIMILVNLTVNSTVISSKSQ